MATIRAGSNTVIVPVNSAAAIALYTGVEGELGMDSSRVALVLHDGSTAGGFTLQASGATPLSAASNSADIIAKVNEMITKLTAAKLMS